MRWRSAPTPVLTGGEKRTRRVFAWRKTIVGEMVVWLEFFEIHERFLAPAGGGPGWWTEVSRNTLDYY